jgi:CheY-like chemotaxis protein
MDRPSEQRRRAERRRLFDRRSPVARRSTERRRTDRRRNSRSVLHERRGRPDRRVQSRRVSMDRRYADTRRHGPRRRETPTPFTTEQLMDVRAGFANPGPTACPSCGSAFILGRPRRRGADVARQVRCRGCGKTAVVINARAARVLIIEQKDVIRETLRTILSGAGHDVVEAADAGVGLAAYELAPPDLVFIDVLGSGRMDAPEFVRRLRQTYPDARVVAMAGRPSYGVMDPLALARQLGATGSIRMPFSRDEVLRVVDATRT